MEHGKATHYRTKEPQGVGNPGVPPYPDTQPKTVGFFKNPMTLMTAPSTEIFPRCYSDLVAITESCGGSVAVGFGRITAR